jgi:hypothetical protein
MSTNLQLFVLGCMLAWALFGPMSFGEKREHLRTLRALGVRPLRRHK